LCLTIRISHTTLEEEVPVGVSQEPPYQLRGLAKRLMRGNS
jgi:hypothetical protein